MKVLNYGSINIDYVYSLDHIVVPGETQSSTGVQRFTGGKGANQSVAIARAGGTIWHAGKINRNDIWIKKELEQAGVRTDLIKAGDCQTGHALIQLESSGENAIILFGGANRSIAESEIEYNLSFFEAGDVLVLQNEINNIPLIMEKAHAKGMKIYLNPAPFSISIRQWPVHLVDTLMLNETEALGLCADECIGDDSSSIDFSLLIQRIAKLYPYTDIVLTAGKQGAYFAHGDSKRQYHVPIMDIPVLDTTAAGDTFLGYYLSSRIRDVAPLEAMKRASYASALTVSRKGAIESIPTEEELEKTFFQQ